jgi:glutaconate CoA-transferase subunit A
METTCPFTGRPHLAVKALNPDLAIIHCQRADETGAAHMWGNLGVVPEAVRASRQVLVTVEEVVSGEVIRSDPNRIVVPGFKVAAVAEVPWGAHPSPMQGYYGHDDDFYVDYAQATREEKDASDWMERWVLGVKDRAEYMRLLGESRMMRLRPSSSAPAAAVEYGF